MSLIFEQPQLNRSKIGTLKNALFISSCHIHARQFPQNDRQVLCLMVLDTGHPPFTMAGGGEEKWHLFPSPALLGVTGDGRSGVKI